MPTFQVLGFALLHLVPAVWGMYHILLFKRDPRAAMGWIIICLFIPYAGPVGYYLFGINRVRSRARSITRSGLSVEYEAGERQLIPALEGHTGIAVVGERITGNVASPGNVVEAYHNGENAYPAMINSINQANNRVLLSTYIFKMDRTGSGFVDALEAAVSRGVDVRVLIDGVGERYSWQRPSKALRKRGISAALFLPPRLLPPSIYLNLRNHRKLLIVDQTAAFAGGMNISDDHVGTASQPAKITDVHFRLCGPIVNALAEIFYQDWDFTTGDRSTTEESILLDCKGDADCRAIADGPNEEMDALALTIQSVIASASTGVDIMTPYFVPSRELIASMQAAALRGIRVRLVLPGKNNLIYVHWANRNMLAELVQSGIQVYYQPAPFCHSKLLCIDRTYCLIGSANLDPRSLRLNFELGIEIFSETLNADLRSHIDQVIANSKPITHEELINRPVPIRLRDSFAGLFAPYL